MIRQILKDTFGRITGSVILPYLLRNNTVIFTFHRVLSCEDYDACRFEKSIVVTDLGLDLFLHYIKQRFQIISLSELANNINDPQTKQQTPRAVITFDDGWRDNYLVALPILRKHQVPATIFLSTDYIDSPKGFWWQHLGEMLAKPGMGSAEQQSIKVTIKAVLGDNNRLEHLSVAKADEIIATLKRYHYDKVPQIVQSIAEVTNTELTPHALSWDECREMSSYGIEFGSHTLTHPRLSLLKGERLESELILSKQRIQSQDINYVDAICYPYGDYNAHTLEQSARHYTIGLTTDSGIVSDKMVSNLALPRINVPELITKQTGLLNYRLLKAAVKRRQHG